MSIGRTVSAVAVACLGALWALHAYATNTNPGCAASVVANCGHSMSQHGVTVQSWHQASAASADHPHSVWWGGYQVVVGYSPYFTKDLYYAYWYGPFYDNWSAQRFWPVGHTSGTAQAAVWIEIQGGEEACTNIGTPYNFDCAQYARLPEPSADRNYSWARRLLARALTLVNV